MAYAESDQGMQLPINRIPDPIAGIAPKPAFFNGIVYFNALGILGFQPSLPCLRVFPDRVSVPATRFSVRCAPATQCCHRAFAAGHPGKTGLAVRPVNEATGVETMSLATHVDTIRLTAEIRTTPVQLIYFSHREGDRNELA
jgi:hypothetical protein